MKAKIFLDKTGYLVRRLLSCCDGDLDERRPALQISGPTNFRREDISIPGLSEMQQTALREKAKTDATKMWESLQPLKSLPSNTFAERPPPPSYEEFTGQTSPTMESGTRRANVQSRLDRVKAHSRRFSDALTKPLGYAPVVREDSRMEMTALMKGHGDLGNLAKLSNESFSEVGSEEEKDGKDVGV